MAVVGAVAAVASAVAGVATGVVSQVQAGKAAKAQRRAEAERRNQQEVQNRRSRLSAIREAQIKRAAVVNFAEGQDIGGSSSVAQATGSIGSQLGTNVGFSEAVNSSNRLISGFNLQAAKAGQSSQFFGGLSNSLFGIGQGAAGFSGSSGFNSLFTNVFGTSPAVSGGGKVGL